MAVKCTLFFTLGTELKDGTVGRLGGWSESYYFGGDAINDSVTKAIKDLIRRRSWLLPKQAKVVAQRMQLVTPDGKPGKSITRLLSVQGNIKYETDTPNMAFGMRGYATAAVNMRMIELRGWPDSQVEKGESKLDDVIARDLKNFQKELIGTWMFRGIKMDVPTIDIEFVETDGTVHTADDFTPPAIGQKVQIIRAKKVGTHDDYFGGIFRVQSITDARTFKVKRYTGPLVERGRVRKYSHDFFVYEDIQDELIFSRKLGRPFFQYRGRAASKS